MDMIADRFANAVSINPLAIAIDSGSKQITYEALNAAVQGLASRLAEQVYPFRAESLRLAAILADHSADAVAITFGTVLAGWAYTPLDPRAGDDALVDMLEQSGADIVFADQSNIARARALADGRCRVLSVEQMLVPLKSKKGKQPSFAPDVADAQAYVLYTSGTTGRPKPIRHSRASLVRSADCYREDSDLRAGDRLSLVLPLGFTPSVFSLFSTLLAGATVCAYDFSESEPYEFGDWIGSSDVTLLYTTPTLFRRWAKRLPDHARTAEAYLPRLRMIQLAGEPLLSSDVALFQKKFARSVQLYNGMGTTETSCAARFVIDHSMQFLDGSVPIGYPYSDVDLIVRNEDGRMVGAGEIGQLHIKSKWKSEAGGYGTEAGFATGDLAMQQEGGRLVHFGRQRDKVAVDGVRVDLLEVESLLMQRADVLEAAVISQASQGTDKTELVAFITPSGGADIDVADLIHWLGERLPSPMVPTRWGVIATLPTLTVGKVDRMALHAQASAQLLRSKPNPHEPDEIDRFVLELFRTLLGKPELGNTAEFFASGGDRKSALALTIAVERAYGIGLSVSWITRIATPINLAHELRRQLASQPDLQVRSDDLGAPWELDHSPALQTEEIDAAELPEAVQLLLNHQNSMTATLSDWSGAPVSLRVLAERQAGRYFMRKIELLCGPERTLAVAGIRIDLVAFDPDVRLEIMAGQTPFGMLLKTHNVAATHRLQSLFRTHQADGPAFGRINRIEDDTGTLLADVIEVLST